MKTARILATLVLGLGAQTASAQLERYPFAPMDGTAARQWGEGTAACWSEATTGNTMCLLLSCRDGGPFEIGLMAFGGDFTLQPRLPVFVTVDGGPITRLDMTPLPRGDGEHAVIAYDPAAHGPLLAALRTGTSARVAVYDPAHLKRDTARLELGMRADLVDAAMANCGAPPLDVSGATSRPAPATTALPSVPDPTATPLSAPDRFVKLDSQVADPQAMAIATRLLAQQLSAEPATSVTAASLAVLANGTRLVVAWHGPSTWSYGMTAYGTYVFRALPQADDFALVYHTPAVEVWIDPAATWDGLPDLWVLGWRGVDRPFGVWRHEEGAYWHLRNVPAR